MTAGVWAVLCGVGIVVGMMAFAWMLCWVAGEGSEQDE